MTTSVRPARTSDLDAIAELERLSFGSPWARDVYAQEIARVFAEVRVAELDGRVVGLCCAWHVSSETHLLRIASHPRVRGRGIGRGLLEDLLVRAAAAGSTVVLLEVGRSNRPAIELYASAGFRVIGLRPGYYTAPPDDAYTMRRTL